MSGIPAHQAFDLQGTRRPGRRRGPSTQPSQRPLGGPAHAAAPEMVSLCSPNPHAGLQPGTLGRGPAAWESRPGP